MAKLSFYLPRYEDPINELQNEVLFGLHMQDEILSLFPPREIIHRGTTRLVSKPNILDRSMRDHHAKECIEPAMFLQTDVLKFRDYVLKLTNSLLDQQKRHTVEVMLETGEAAGNSIDGKGRNFWDAYIEMLRKAPYNKHGYTLYMHPDTESWLQN